MKRKNEKFEDNSFGERLETAIKKQFKNQSAFAEKIGVTQATVSRYITGNALPSFHILRKMSDILKIDFGILTYGSSAKPAQEGIVSVPFFYSEVSAGRGLESISEARDTLYFDESFLKNQFLIKNVQDMFALRVKGDSMEPIISEGDIVFAQPHNQETSSQGIYIVCYNSEYFIKKIQFKSRESVKLISANREYDPIDVDLKDDTTVFAVLAKVVGRISVKNFMSYSLTE
jgi:repressor LexA